MCIKKKKWGSEKFFILPKVTQLVSVDTGLEAESGSWHSPHHLWTAAGLFPLFSHYHTQLPLKNPSWGRLQFFVCSVCLSDPTVCLVTCSVSMPAWRQHPLLAATYGAGVRWTGLRPPLLGDWGWEGSVLLMPYLKGIFHFLAFLFRIPHLSPLYFSSDPSGSVPFSGADNIWGRRVPGLRALAHLCTEPRSPGAWSPAGIDVKRQQIAAYRRLTWTLLHTPFLPCPLPLLCTRALAGYKRRERGVPRQRRVSAPWRAPAFGCCPSWVPPYCCCYLCWAPVPRRTPSSSPEPWTSTLPWRMPPMRRSWSVSPTPQIPLGCRAVPFFVPPLSPSSPAPSPESGRARGGERKVQAPRTVSSPRAPRQSVEQISCPCSSERQEPPRLWVLLSVPRTAS